MNFKKWWKYFLSYDAYLHWFTTGRMLHKPLKNKKVVTSYKIVEISMMPDGSFEPTFIVEKRVK